MIPKVTKGGSSFKGAFRYYLHDKNADTMERVAWTETQNMRTNDPAKAWKIMAYTAKEQNRLKEATGQSRAGRKLEKPVFAFSLAWHPEQNPSKHHMLETSRKAIDMLGLTEHEAMIVAHRDEPQKHVHVIVNRVHPITGMAADVRNSKRKFSDFARAYEHEHGKIYCEQREANHEEREKGNSTRYGDPEIIEAWDLSDSGEAFKDHLEARGYTLAMGRKRIVVVDPHGKTHNPVRHLKDVRAKYFNEVVSDLDHSRLPDADEVVAQRKKPEPVQEKHKAVFERLAQMQFDTLVQKQLHERDRLKHQHRQRFDSAKKRLVLYYQLPQRKRELIKLKHQIDNAPWWKRLLGFTKKDREQFADKHQTYRSAIHRYREKLSTLKSQSKEAMQVLQQRQSRETAELQVFLDHQRSTGSYSMEPRREQFKQQAKERLERNISNGREI